MNSRTIVIFQTLLLIVGLISIFLGAILSHWGATISGTICVFVAMSGLIFSGGYEV